MSAFRILTIDGGGFRGAYSAYLLKKIEQECGVSLHESFDLIAGTSTGSIIAAALACKKPASEIFDMYEQHGQAIFRKRWFCRLGLFGSKYKSTYLKSVLESVFGDKTLGNVSYPLIIPATDIGNGCVHVFKSQYDNDFVRDKNVRIVDAVLASCSAPTFFNPHTVGNYQLADGGLWANCPSLVAAIDAKNRLGKAFVDLKILSIGTGTGKQYYPQRKGLLKRLMGWGFATRWGRGRFINMLLNLQSQNANNMLGLILDSGQILRLNFDSDLELPLDDPRELADLTSKADHDFSHNSEPIRSFLGLENKC